MGIADFFKKLFKAEDDIDDPELIAARKRHGIEVETPEEQLWRAQNEKEEYDPWEEVGNSRVNFFLGSWASRKFRIIGEDKMKKQLDELEQKRLKEELKKAEEKK